MLSAMRTIKYGLLISHPKPSMALREKRMTVIRRGINNGKPRIAIMAALFPARETSAEIRVNTIAREDEPSINPVINMGRSAMMLPKRMQYARKLTTVIT